MSTQFHDMTMQKLRLQQDTYKDKKTTISTHAFIRNTPRTRIVLFLVTIVLLITFSIHSLRDDDPRSIDVSDRGTRRAIERLYGQQAAYQDSDVDYSKHDLDYSKVGVKKKKKNGRAGVDINVNGIKKGTTNDGVDESNIDRSLDSKVVGSIAKGGDKVKDEGLVEFTKDRGTLKKGDKENPSIKALNKDHKALKALEPNTPKKDEVEFKLDHNVQHNEHTNDHSGKKLAVTPEEKLKPVIEQFKNGGVRVVDRINMAS